MVQEKLSGGYIFDIQGFSVHDGPGCRTLIFFKGCSLHCSWCSNPEGISPFPELLYNLEKCNSDLLCLESCKARAIIIQEGFLHFDSAKCNVCSTHDCARACCTGALQPGGYFISTGELYSKIQRDRQYWGGKGGITLTGGEPFCQPEFTLDLLKICYDRYIHTAAETCGNIPWKNIEPSLPYLDWIFFDLKQMDQEKHQNATGKSNDLILENANRLASKFPGRLVFRMPVIPGFNDNKDHILKMITFIKSTGRKEINILPVHHLGRDKYPLTGRKYSLDSSRIPAALEMQKIQSFFSGEGIQCYIGSETPF